MRSSIVVLGLFVNCVCCGVVSSSNGNSERNSYHLRNVNYRNKTAQTTDAASDPNLDTELIVLPINAEHIHADQVMARLTATSTPATVDPLFDYSVYLGKPFVFDYTKALKDAIEQAKRDVLESNYNLDESTFAGADDLPQRNDAPRFKPIQPSALQVELFGTDGQGPRSEKLVRHPVSFSTAGANTLPIGLAFFDALREQNNRPYSEAFAAPAFAFSAALNQPTTTPMPTTTAAPVEHSELLYEVREDAELLDNNTDWINQDTPVDSYEYNYNKDVEPIETSTELDKHRQAALQLEPHNTDTNNEGNYEYHVIKTFSDTYGTKPVVKHNKFSRIKVIQENKVTTDKPHAFERKKPYTQKRRNSQTTPAPAVASTSTPRSNYLFNGEVYHPDESKKLLIVVDGKSEATQHTIRSSRKRRQLDLPGGFLSFPQRHRPLSYRRQQSDDVESITTKPATTPMKPAPKKPKKTNKPKKPTTPAKATTAPPVELRYFQ